MMISIEIKEPRVEAQFSLIQCLEAHSNPVVDWVTICVRVLTGPKAAWLLRDSRILKESV